MRNILILPVLLIVAVIRVAFYLMELALYVPYSAVKAVADGAGAILLDLISKGEFDVKRKQPGAVVGKVTPSQPEAE